MPTYSGKNSSVPASPTRRAQRHTMKRAAMLLPIILSGRAMILVDRRRAHFIKPPLEAFRNTDGRKI